MTSAVHCKPKAILLGAFDRFNYGDLLFPLVIYETNLHSLRPRNRNCGSCTRGQRLDSFWRTENESS